MATSSIPAFKAALKTRLEADVGLTGVMVSRGFPFPLKPDSDLVIVGRALDDDPHTGSRFAGGQRAAALGMQSREERYSVEVHVEVRRQDRNAYADLEDRAYAIAAVIETSVRTWGSTTPSAFGGVVRTAQVMSVEDGERIDNVAKERVAGVRLAIAVTNRI